MLLQMFVDTRNTQVVIKNILISSEQFNSITDFALTKHSLL
jgi:hypothetical protein